MDLNKEKTDSGLLNEIKDLMNKKTVQEPKKQDPDDDFDEMIQELDNAQKKDMKKPSQPEPITNKEDVPFTQKSNPQPSEVTQEEIITNKPDELPSFEGIKKPTQVEDGLDEQPTLYNQQDEEIDLLVPAPPPELMQEKTPRIDVDRLMNVEEIYLTNKGKEKYGSFKIKQEIDPRKPIFINVDNYEGTLRKMIEIKASTSEFSEILFRLENLGDSQTSNFSNLHNQLEDIQRKMIFIDTLIFEKL